MVSRFLSLEWKSFKRAASFKTNLAVKIIIWFFIGLFALELLLGGAVAFKLIEKADIGDPLRVVSRYLLIYFVVDAFMRYMLQKMPVLNIKPLLLQNVKRRTIVNYALGKTAFSPFNFLQYFILVPFTIVLLTQGYGLGAVTWFLAIVALMYTMNYTNVLVNKNTNLALTIGAAILALYLLRYFGVFDILEYSESFFYAFYDQPYLVLGPLALLFLVYKLAYEYFYKRLYLDTGLKAKTAVANGQDYTFLERFGSASTFLKNDLKMLLRNKRSKSTLILSFVFVGYGLLFGSGAIEVYDGPIFKAFGAIFSTGGFLFMFGQFIPAWDSSYYGLIMTQNVTYRNYLKSKWTLMVIGTIISMLLCTFYLYFGLETYLLFMAAGIFNIGLNAAMVMWGGAYVRTPIDLQSSKQAFGNSSSFNIKTLLLSLPKMVVPVAVYALGYYLSGNNAYIAAAVLAGSGLLGLLLRDKIFNLIENIYKREKYKTIAAFNEKP